MTIIRYVGNLQQETTTTALRITVAQMQECVSSLMAVTNSLLLLHRCSVKFQHQFKLEVVM